MEDRSSHGPRRQRSPDANGEAGTSSAFARSIYSDDDLTGIHVRELRQLLAEEATLDAGTDPEPAGASPPPSTRRTRRSRRIVTALRRAVVGLLSLAVFAVTGLSWAGLQHVESRLNTTEALAQVPRPASTGPDDGATDILLVGSDSRTDANGNPLPLEVLKLLRTEESAGLNTDTLILIRVPNDGSAAFAVSIPRDTYVPIPGYRDGKINSAYGVSKREAADELRGQGVTDGALIERESAAAGQRTLVQTVQELTGVEIDHYAEVNLYGFYLLTQAIGGVEVCLTRATRDTDSGADFRKGRQTISGGDALSFVRQRAQLPRGDLDRIVRQQVFMAALVRKTLAAGTLTDPARLSALLDAVQQSVVLDAGWDVLGFATQLQGLAAGNVQFHTIPVLKVDARNERGQSIVTVDRAAVHAFVAGMLQDRATAASPSASPAPSGSAAAPSAPDPVVIAVSNGTRRVGLAGRVTQALTGMGFHASTADNVAGRRRTEVRVAPGSRPGGERVAAALGGLPVVADASVAAGRAEVLLGADYAGPGLQPPTATTPAPATAPPPATAAEEDAPITADGIPCVN